MLENFVNAPARHRILCVDDDPAVCELLVLRFLNAGFSAQAVSCASDALRLVEREPVDLLVLDYEMPGMNGIELAAELRRRVPKTPLVMISGNGAVPESALRLVDRFVPKGAGLAAKLISEASSLLDSMRPRP